jgi:chemotaxis protein MotB
MFRKIILSGILLSCLASPAMAGKKLKKARAQITQLEQANADLTSQNANLQSNLSAVKNEFASYKEGCEATQEKLREVTGLLEEEYETLRRVEAQLSTALADFQNKGVEVYSKGGMVYVSMQDKLLYKSGSSVLGQEGKEALGKVASALNDYPKLKVIVLGHTDDEQFTKRKTDNWSLSTERANSVVRVLRDSYSVDPSRLTAAGKSKYAPVADNASAEGRAKNRRTEIILNPNLERIWENAQK